jgi:hypothetical protein
MRQAPKSTRPPYRVRHPRTQVGNLALVPASQLASIQKWQQASKQLPAGDVLFVLPKDNLRLREAGCKLDDALRVRGRRSRIQTI